MGDLANMTDCDGRVNGTRLLRWLRSREKLADQRALGMLQKSRWESEAYQNGVRDVLREMADDLERELTPPDYSEDQDDGEGDAVLGDLRTCPDCDARHNVRRTVDGCCPVCVGRRTPAGDDEFTLLGLMTTGPCDGCGRVTDRVEVRDNGRAWFACQDCADRLGDDAVDLDDPAFLGRPEQE